MATKQRYKSQPRPATVKVEEKKGYWEMDEDDLDEDKFLFADNKRRGTSLILNDTFLLIIHYLQTLAVIQSLSLRWPWPETWISNTNFLFLFNLDVWDFLKVHTNSTYKSVKGYYTPSDTIPISYWHVMLGWGLFMFLAVVLFIIIYVYLTAKKNPSLLVQLSRLQRVYIIGVQLISMPLGIVIARLFWCTDTGKADVSNDLFCFSGTHWAYLAPSFAAVVLFYILFSYWLIQKTKGEILCMTSDRHEGYLQLKETEYAHGLDILWVVAGFHIFCSFKRQGAHFRAAMHLVHCFLFVIYAAFPSFLFPQAIMVNVLLLVLFITFIILRPFRVMAFNVMIIMNYLCLCSNALVGTMITSFDSFTVQSVWLLPSYTLWILIFINSVWLFACLVFISYIVILSCGCFKWSTPIWPSMTSKGISNLSEHTQKFIRSILQARILLEKCLSMPAIFAPAHELARHIQIINAYCREAIILSDPMQDSLWDLLDELIEAHCRIAPRSLFAESVKHSIRHTAAEFMKMIPQFSRRVAQREYDFILMTPVKRRMLLKMYCLSMLLNGRREKLRREELVVPAVREIWQDRGEGFTVETEDDGYFEDMYPLPLKGPALIRPETALSLDLRSELDQDDAHVLEEAEMWAEEHPVTTRGVDVAFNNPAYEGDDVSAILKDSESVDLSVMMEGIPSRPGTADRDTKQEERTECMSEFASVTLPPMSRQHTMTTQPDLGHHAEFLMEDAEDVDGGYNDASMKKK